jgi:hypothetical protein
MIPVPLSVMNDYVAILRDREISSGHIEYYKKWLQYFYDFSARYLNTDDKAEKVKLFLEKLRSKQQTPAQCQQAAHAISLYFKMQSQCTPENMTDGKSALQQNPIKEQELSTPLPRLPSANVFSALSFREHPSQYSAAGYDEKSDSPEWDEVLVKMADEIKVRHYSRKTLQTYALWSRQFHER